jgi:hypothetical protein
MSFYSLFSDDYFVSNVDKIESLNSGRKEKLMTTRSNWSENFQQALSACSGFKNIESGVVQVRFDPNSFFSFWY